MRLRSLLWVPLVLGLSPLHAHAELITFAFTGTVGPCQSLFGCIPVPWSDGDFLSGYYVFEADTPPSPADIPSRHLYRAVTGLTINVGGTQKTGSSGDIYVETQGEKGSPFYTETYNVFLFTSDGWILDLLVQSRTTSILDDSSLPIVPPDLSSAGTSSRSEMFHPEFGEDSGGSSFPGDLATLVRVPEPRISMLLYGLCFFGVAVGRLFSRSKTDRGSDTAIQRRIS